MDIDWVDGAEATDWEPDSAFSLPAGFLPLAWHCLAQSVIVGTVLVFRSPQPQLASLPQRPPLQL